MTYFARNRQDHDIVTHGGCKSLEQNLSSRHRESRASNPAVWRSSSCLPIDASDLVSLPYQRKGLQILHTRQMYTLKVLSNNSIIIAVVHLWG